MPLTRARGAISFRALMASVVFHLLVLLLFCFIRFSRPVPATIARTIPLAQIKQVEEFLKNEVVVPKPIVEPVSEGHIEKITQDSFGADKIFKRGGIKESEFPLPAKSKGLRSYSFEREGFSPEVDFFGTKTVDRKICFVVDCSGSMKGSMGRVQANLKRTISELQQDQFFCIVFFGDGKLFEFADGDLVRASKQAKSRAYSFIDTVRAGGRTNAFEALSRAVRIGEEGLRPSVFYFLTDGFELPEKGRGDFLGRMEVLFKTFASQARINTIGFWPAAEDIAILEKIAQSSGGKCIIITEDES